MWYMCEIIAVKGLNNKGLKNGSSEEVKGYIVW